MDHANKQPTFVNTSNARTGGYADVIHKISKDNVCPFCPDQLARYHKNPILLEGHFWQATDCMYPYKDTKTHLLFIYKDHIEGPVELSKEAWEELHDLVKDFIEKRDIPGGTILMRFGETKYTGASVTHLHAHLVSSDPDKEGYEPVITRVG